MSLRNGQIFVVLSAILLVLISLFVSRKIVDYEGQLKTLAEDKREYYLLADTMRQTSYDLTKMARMYVVTGNESYKDYFDAILDIRYGIISRPEEYYKVYWDIVLAEGGKLPRISKNQISHLDILRDADLTDMELELLKESERNSDDLIELEKEAMNTLEGIYKDRKGNYTIKDEPNKPLAISMLHNQDYNEAKGHVMGPILGFFNLVEERITLKESLLRKKQNRLRVLFNMSMGLSLILVLALALFPLYLMRDKKIKKPEITKKGILSFIRTNLIESWPIATATLTAIFATYMVAWWFTGEVKEKTSENLSARLKIDLQFAYDSLTHWTEVKTLETTILADNVNYLIRDKFNNRLNSQKLSELNFEIERRMYALEGHANSKFLILDENGKVITSNATSQVEAGFELEIEMLERLKTLRTSAYHLNDSKTTAKLTNNRVELMFGTTTNIGSDMYIVVLVVPISEVSKILKRTFLDASGELYLVSSEGRLITESASFEKLIGQETPDTDSAIGLRLSTEPNNPQAPLIKSVASVIDDKVNEDVTIPYANYLEKTVIGSWKWNNIHNFGLVREINTDDALGSFYIYRTYTQISSTITISLILLLFSIFAVNRTKLRKANDEIATTYETIKRQQDRLKRDLATGQQVQMSMLPEIIETTEFSVDAMLKPAQMVSGDFYDFSYIGFNQDKFYFSVGDVSGKGIPAALFMSVTKAMINKVIDQKFFTSHEIVTRVNRELCMNNSSCVFITLVLCVVDLKSGKVQLTNAGHNPPMLRKRDGTLKTLDAPDGPVLGIFDDVEYSHQEILLDKRDNIICYTDGITEAQNNKKEFYGEDRLITLLKNGTYTSPRDIIDSVAIDVTRFIKEAPQFDDITLLSFEYKSRFK